MLRMKSLRIYALIFLCYASQTVFFVVTGSANASEAPTKIAIVIGNSAYPSGALENPKNDAKAIAATFKKLGFEVLLRLDATKSETDAAFKLFSQKSDKAAVAALFYAGHGMQINGGNYIIPIDANPKSERDIKREMLKMDDVIDDMGNAKVKLVFFDACRDNPLTRSFSRGGSRGLVAPIEASGTLISFATKHGNTAADGDGQHSPYTQALLNELGNPAGMEIEQILRRVQQQVRSTTGGRQEPWRYGSLDGDFFFQESAPKADSAVQQQAIEKAVNEALKRANEQASRERSELQQSMEKILKEALRRQNIALENERIARIQAESKNTQPANLPATAPISTLSSITTGPKQNTSPVQKIDTTSAPKVSPSSVTPLPEKDDEWEYLSKDLWGKTTTILSRVKASVQSTGTVEEFFLNNKLVGEWVLDGKPMLISMPIEASMMLAPYWGGKEIDKITIQAGTKCAMEWLCKSSASVVGREKISVPAGVFDTNKVQVNINATHSNSFVGTSPMSGTLVIEGWYAESSGRLIKQTSYANGFYGRIKIDESIVLSANRASTLGKNQ